VIDGPRRSGGATWYPLAAAAIVGAIALAAITAVPVGVFWDDGVYLIGAKSLATGAGYRFLQLPGAPPAVHFPPAWPALLAIVWKLGPSFPDNVVLLKLVNPLLLAVGAGLACRYGARRLDVPPPVAAAAAVVFAAALPVMVIAGVLFSEPFFFLALLLALGFADRAVDSGGWRAAIAAGIAAGALALVRSAGIALVPAVVVALLLARRRREAAIAGAAAVALLAPWQLWIAAHAHDLAAPFRGSYGPYLGWVLGMYHERGAAFALVMARMNLLSVMRSLGITLFPFGPRDIRPLLVTLVLVVGAIAAIRARRRAATALLFLLFYFTIVFAWPYSPDRFMWAIWPLLGMLLASGAVECWRIGAHRGAVPSVRVTSAFACAIGIFAVAGHAGYSIRGASRHWWDSAARGNADALIPVADWINTNTRPDDVVAVDGEPFIYLHTGRTVVPVHILSPDEYFAGTPLDRAAADLRALIAVGKPRYAVFSGAAGEREAAPMLDGRNGTPKLEWIAALPGGGAAYRVVLAP
jgi:4-amino-4-deoxy-L-arabinose transferase-like glycosyltransferase